MKTRLLLLLIVLLAVALRVGYAMVLPNVVIVPDEKDYFTAAEELVTQGSFFQTVKTHVPPVVPVFFASCMTVVPRDYRSLRVSQSFLSAILVIVLFFFGRELTGDRGGLLAAFLGAVYPYFVYFSGFVLSEAAAIVVIPSALYMGFRAIQGRRPAVLFAFGLMVAVAALTRAAVLDFILLVPFVLWMSWGGGPLRPLKAGAIVLAGFFLLYGPWMAVNRAYFGEWIWPPTTGGGVMLYQTGLKMEMPDEERRREFLEREIFPKYYKPSEGGLPARLAGDAWLWNEGKRMILKHLSEYPAVMWQNALRFWQFFPHSPEGPQSVQARRYRFVGLGSYGVLFPFFVIGLVVSLTRWRKFILIYSFIGYYTAVHIVLYGKLRYRVPMDSLLILFGVLGLFWVFNCIRERLGRDALPILWPQTLGREEGER